MLQCKDQLVSHQAKHLLNHHNSQKMKLSFRQLCKQPLRRKKLSVFKQQKKKRQVWNNKPLLLISRDKHLQLKKREWLLKHRSLSLREPKKMLSVNVLKSKPHLLALLKKKLKP